MGYFQGVQLSPLGFAACQSKNCTNKFEGTNRMHLPLCWCS